MSISLSEMHRLEGLRVDVYFNTDKGPVGFTVASDWRIEDDCLIGRVEILNETRQIPLQDLMSITQRDSNVDESERRNQGDVYLTDR